MKAPPLAPGLYPSRRLLRKLLRMRGGSSMTQSEGGDLPCRTGLLCLPLAGGFPERYSHARCRRKGAVANDLAADALDPVAVDRRRTGADHRAGDRLAAAVELVCDLWRALAGRPARSGLAFV